MLGKVNGDARGAEVVVVVVDVEDELVVVEAGGVAVVGEPGVGEPGVGIELVGTDDEVVAAVSSTTGGKTPSIRPVIGPGARNGPMYLESLATTVI
ncbi:MAG: hypothetical protein ACSLFB_01930 [Acidimicrobiales bacterium]